jgi:hypothetical protein
MNITEIRSKEFVERHGELIFRVLNGQHQIYVCEDKQNSAMAIIAKITPTSEQCFQIALEDIATFVNDIIDPIRK